MVFFIFIPLLPYPSMNVLPSSLGPFSDIASFLARAVDGVRWNVLADSPFCRMKLKLWQQNAFSHPANMWVLSSKTRAYLYIQLFQIVSDGFCAFFRVLYSERGHIVLCNGVNANFSD